MHRATPLAIAACAVACCQVELRAQQPVSDSAEVRAAGTASRAVRPDLATLTLQFAVVDSTPMLTGRGLAVRADSVRRALVALGIPRDSLVTGSRWYWWGGRVEVIPHQACVPGPDPRRGCVMAYDTTYRVREIIQVRIHDLSRVGQVIDTALALGITDISNVTFSATDTREAQTAAVREATLRAREQAEAIAGASGGRLGRVLSLSTEADYSSRFGSLTEVVVTGGVEGGQSGTVITAPSVTVRATVYGRWRLEEH